MSQPTGLHRKDAAAFVSKQAAYHVPEPTLRFWEARGLLRDQNPGHRAPCSYGVPELIGAATIAALRRDGASLQRVRRALRELRRLIPDILEHPGTWRLAVDGRGQVVRVEDSTTLLELTGETPGQLTVTIFDAGAFATEARAVIDRKLRAAS